MKKFLLIISLAGVLAACNSNKSTISPEAQLTQNWTAAEIYNEARTELNSGNYKRAIELYELLRARQSEGRFTEQSLLESAYAHYKEEEPTKALYDLSRFEQNFPASVDMDYALYLRGLILFNEDQSFLNKLASQDWSDRDPEANRRAYLQFERLLTLYPQSKYASDAKERMAKLLDAMAEHELSIARYYAKRGAFLAANNRAQSIIRQYQNTRHVEEALAIMIYTYGKMNNAQLKADTQRVLQVNFPKSPYLTHDWQANDMPWWRYWK